MCIRDRASHARKDSTRHANRRALLDAAVPRLGGGGQPIAGLPEIGILSAQVGYADAGAWRRSCPHLSIWEDAISDGLVRFQNGSSMGQSLLVLTARGRAGAARSALSRPSHFFCA